MSVVGTQTKVFGIPIQVNPKLVILSLVSFAGVLFWFNSCSDEPEKGPIATVRGRPEETQHVAGRARAKMRRMNANLNERGALRLRPLDLQTGNFDPTLRIDLLQRLANVEPAKEMRNLFEFSSPPIPQAAESLIAPMTLVPVVPMSVGTLVPPINIPLKYYGFVHAEDSGVSRQGFFMDGDNILIASEGELLKAHYMVVTLTATGARMEDTQLKQVQILPLVPELATP